MIYCWRAILNVGQDLLLVSHKQVHQGVVSPSSKQQLKFPPHFIALDPKHLEIRSKGVRAGEHMLALFGRLEYDLIAYEIAVRVEVVSLMASAASSKKRFQSYGLKTLGAPYRGCGKAPTFQTQPPLVHFVVMAGS